MRMSPRMRSCLYECQVLHHRFAPKTHRFVYRIFFSSLLDLDELPVWHRKLGALFGQSPQPLFVPGGRLPAAWESRPR